jgi:molybdenum cofactor cytidylyltransferase
MVGIVLGAGESKRLGRPKQTLPFGDTTLLGHVLRDVEDSSLERVVLVVGGAAEEALAAITPRRAEVVRNDSYGSGCASSLLAGLDATGSEEEAVMLVLGDMPGVGPAVIDAVADTWEERHPWASVTSYRGDLGHPFVFARAAFPDLRGLHGDKAVWKLIERHPERVERIDLDRPLPRDVDTWADYEAALSVVRAAG